MMSDALRGRGQSARRASTLLCATLVFAAAGAAASRAWAQTPAGAQAPVRGIQANTDHPVLPIGSPLPDFYLGAHAAVAGYRLLTRDASRYRTCFPTVELIAPGE